MCARFVSAALTVVALTAAPVLLSASDKSAPAKKGKAVQSRTVEKASSTFVKLKDIQAVPMAAKELDAVKGLHVHFWNPGAPFPGEPHLAGANNTDHWSNLYGDGFVANSYHGLCVAAANGSAIFINPHGGCG